MDPNPQRSNRPPSSLHRGGLHPLERVGKIRPHFSLDQNLCEMNKTKHRTQKKISPAAYNNLNITPKIFACGAVEKPNTFTVGAFFREGCFFSGDSLSKYSVKKFFLKILLFKISAKSTKENIAQKNFRLRRTNEQRTNHTSKNNKCLPRTNNLNITPQFFACGVLKQNKNTYSYLIPLIKLSEFK